MLPLPKSLMQLAQSLQGLPGVGEKSAFRHALAISRWPEARRAELKRSMEAIDEIHQCQKCNFITDQEICHICLDQNRSSELCIVENITDLMAIESSGYFKGKYFVLGGVLNPLLGIGAEELALDKLFKQILEENFTQILLAINPSVEGDATCVYIRQELPSSLRIERIGFGIPIGSSLEYLDPATISKALENRKQME